jgi:hypothetical protein
MRTRTTLSVAILAAAVLLLSLVSPAGASAGVKPRFAVRGGTTTLLTAPGLVSKLLGAKLVALVTAPGSQTLRGSGAASRLVASYPVRGGSVTAVPLRGQYGHAGGLFITNLGTTPAKSVSVDTFVVNLNTRTLSAHVPALNARRPVFSLDLSHRRIVSRPHFVLISGIVVRLRSDAAALLNFALGTTAFTGGMLFGTASSRINR